MERAPLPGSPPHEVTLRQGSPTLSPLPDASPSGARALLVGLEWSKSSGWAVDESLEELARLVESAGMEVAGAVVQRRQRPDPATFIGRGKAQKLAEERALLGYDTVVFDDDLSPAQERNLERVLGARVTDRSGLILDIFARRARTREAMLQVELAQLEYLLPRLTRAWGHLERQRGATRGRGGPGEQQLELDRRQVKERIAQVRRELEQVRSHRGRLRAARRDGPPIVALVGYTNAGKSTLMSRLTGADVVAQDLLFATLDPTARRLSLPSGGAAILTDTVGFIQKLPPQLVAAFRATLEELEEADLLLHVVDTAHPRAADQAAAVRAVLADLGLDHKPVLLVLNKCDLLPGPPPALPSGAVAVSALSGAGLDALKERIAVALAEQAVAVEVRLPYAATALVALFRREGLLIEERYTSQGVLLRGRLPPRLIPRFASAGHLRRH